MYARRDLLHILAAAVTAAPLSSMGYGAEPQRETPEALTQAFNPEALAFWTEEALRPRASTLSAPGSIPAGEARKPQIFIHTRNEGFRVPTNPPVKVGELQMVNQPKVTVRVVAFKPSDHDQRDIQSSDSGTLRLDLLQQGMLPSEAGHPGTEGSTAISGQAINGQNKKLDPTSLVSRLTVGDAQVITLPDGGGWLSCTFFFQRKEALWHKVLEACLKVSAIAANNFVPIFNIGATPKKDWNAINAMMGSLFPVPDSNERNGSTSWLFAPEIKPVAASQRAFSSPSFAAGVPLIKDAYYLLVPEDQYQDFGRVMSKMALTADGYVVPQSIQSSDPAGVYTAIWGTPELRDITYLTLHCENVTEAAANPSEGKPGTKVG
jgi:hypothetical protein